MKHLLSTRRKLRPEGVTHPETRPYTVLVADDDSAMRTMLVEWLESSNCNVIECASGSRLIDSILKMPPRELRKLDAIVTDERMPGSNGLEAIESMWFIPLPPVLLITAYADSKVLARAKELGGISVLPKPLDRSALVEALLELVQAPRPNPETPHSVGS